MGGDSTWLICPNTRVGLPNPLKSAQQKYSKESLAERADARYPIEKRIGPMDRLGAMEEKAALSEGACDGQVCFVPRGGPLPVALVRGMRVALGNHGATVSKYKKMSTLLQTPPHHLACHEKNGPLLRALLWCLVWMELGPIPMRDFL
jgi:hypothetical protein